MSIAVTTTSNEDAGDRAGGTVMGAPVEGGRAGGRSHHPRRVIRAGNRTAASRGRPETLTVTATGAERATVTRPLRLGRY
jgi:hypothetical protein